MTNGQILTPTEVAMSNFDIERNNGFFRLLPKFRYGVVSGEVWSRTPLEKEVRKRVVSGQVRRVGGEEVDSSALAELQQRSAEGPSSHDKEVRAKGRQKGLLRKGEQVRSGEKREGEGELDLQEGRKPRSAQARKKKAPVTKKSRKETR